MSDWIRSSSTAERMKIALQKAHMKQVELSRITGIDKGSISNYLYGRYEPKSDAINKMATALNVSEMWLWGYDVPMDRQDKKISNIIPLPEMRKIPLLGTIACGEPILAEENIEDEIDIPAEIKADFALTCKGDSMINARIFDGDIVYLRQQNTVENGDIAAVLIDDEATLKRVKLYSDHISLEPENPQYRPLVFWGEEMNNVRIIGKALAFTSAIK